MRAVVTRLFTWLLPVAFATGSVLASSEDFRSVSDIEAALDPLEFVADYDGVRVSIDLTIHFAFDSARIQPQSEAQLDALGNALSGERLAGYRFKLIGHTDGVGSVAYNQQLSEARANAVRDALISRYQVDAERLFAEGQGETQLKPGLADDAAAHRRVEVQTLLEEPAPTPTDREVDLDAVLREGG